VHAAWVASLPTCHDLSMDACVKESSRRDSAWHCHVVCSWWSAANPAAMCQQSLLAAVLCWLILEDPLIG
jgi:hypothetical protein